jgi:hypothetical protein
MTQLNSFYVLFLCFFSKDQACEQNTFLNFGFTSRIEDDVGTKTGACTWFLLFGRFGL